MKKIIYVVALLFLTAAVQDARAGLFDRKKKDAKEEKKEVVTPYQKLFKDKKVETAKGEAMTIHKVGDKIYVEFPLNLLERDMLLTSSIVSTSDGGEGYAGQFGGRDVRLQFTRQDSTIQARMFLLSKPMNTGNDPGVEQALGYSNMPGIFKSFKILAYTPDSSAVVLDMKKLFFESSTYTKPFPTDAANAYYGFVSRSHRLQSDKSFIRGIKAFDNNVVVNCEMSYLVDHTLMGAFSMYEDVPLTAEINKILMVLPKESMRPRVADSRIGVTPINKTDIAKAGAAIKPLRFAKRWNIEPADRDKYLRGELCDPKQPIVFYMDTLLPQAWKAYIKEGALSWNKAFEKIGFSNVIRVEEFPADSTFDANDINRSTIRYSPSWINYIQTTTHMDARSGEIINASININANLMTLSYYKLLATTMAFDPQVRTNTPDPELLGGLIKGEIARAVGTCLGLANNMGASYSYPVDSLRSATFTQKYGLSPSIMDEITCNSIVGPEEVAQGVKLVHNELGEYDYYAIKWLYKPIYDVSYLDEVKTLDQWIREEENNPYCRFNRRQPYYSDPRNISGLGNDHILVMKYTLPNIKKAYQNYFEWYAEGDRTLDLRRRIRSYIYDQFTDKMYRVLTYVGGMQINDVREGSAMSSYQTVPKAKQKEAMNYVLGLAKDLAWLDVDSLSTQFEIEDPLAVRCRFDIFSSLMGRMDYVAACADKSSDPYTPQEYMADIYNTVWESTRKNRKPDHFEMEIQKAFLGSIINISSVTGSIGSFKASKEDYFAFAPMTGRRAEITPENWKAVELRMKDAGMDAESAGYSFDSGQVSAFNPAGPVRVDQSSLAAEYFDILIKTRDMLTNAAARSTGDVKLHYDLMLYQIKKAIEIK